MRLLNRFVPFNKWCFKTRARRESLVFPCPQTRADYKSEEQALRDVGDLHVAAKERDRLDERCRKLLCEETRQQEEPLRKKGKKRPRVLPWQVEARCRRA